jgi:hypothetical protein
MLAEHFATANANELGDDRRAASVHAPEGPRAAGYIAMSDDDAINALRHADRAARTKVWLDRFSAIADIRAEFGTASDYAAFMNALAEGRIRMLAPKPGVYRNGRQK